MSLEAIFVQSALALLAAVSASYVTVQLSLKRFYREKLWERKLAAYISVIDALHEMKVVFEDEFEAYRDGWDFEPAEQKQLHIQKNQARANIRRQADTAGLLIAQECAHQILKMRRALEIGHHNLKATHDGLDEACMDVRVVADCLERVKTIAHNDLLGGVGYFGRRDLPGLLQTNARRPSTKHGEPTLQGT